MYGLWSEGCEAYTQTQENLAGSNDLKSFHLVNFDAINCD